MAINILSKTVFFDKLNNNEFFGDEVGCNYEIVIDSQIVNWDFRVIKNVTFDELVEVSNVDIKSGLAFINCTFKKGIALKDVESKNYDSNLNPNNFSILFSSCKASHISFTGKCHFEREILINEESSIGKLVIYGTQIVNSGIILKDSTVTKLFDISNAHFDLEINNSILVKQLRIETLIGDIAMLSSTFKDWVKFWNVECSYSITLNKNKFEDTFDIEASRINGIFIHGDTFEKKATLENRDLSGKNKKTYLNEIYITEANFVEGFDFNGLGKSIEKITLPTTPKFQGVLKFEGWQVDSFLISGISQNIKLLFKRVSFRFFMINDFTNYSDISFDKCKGFGDCTLNLSNCDLGTTKFNEFEFDSFLKVRIDNVALDNINPMCSSWFKDEVLEIGDGTQTKQSEFKSKREVYRQIKQALKNNGNQIDSLIFQGRELLAYRNELKNSENYKFSDRIIMSVSWSNSYGLNWIKPVLIVIGVTLLIYIILLPCLSSKITYTISFTFENFKNTWVAFSNNFKIFWQLFNPIRKMNDICGKADSGWIYFLDLVHRIFLGIMIFQIIKAFRKHVSN